MAKTQQSGKLVLATIMIEGGDQGLYRAEGKILEKSLATQGYNTTIRWYDSGKLEISGDKPIDPDVLRGVLRERQVRRSGAKIVLEDLLPSDTPNLLNRVQALTEQLEGTRVELGRTEKRYTAAQEAQRSAERQARENEELAAEYDREVGRLKTESGGRLDEIKRLRLQLDGLETRLRDESGKVRIGGDALSAATMKVLNYEAYARIEVPRMGKLMERIETAIVKVMVEHQVADRSELYERVVQGAFDADEVLTNYAQRKQEYDAAVTAKKMVETNPASARLVNLNLAKTTIDQFEALQRYHETSKVLRKQLAADLQEVNNQFLFYVELGQDAKQYTLTIHTPIAYASEKETLNQTQSEILGIIAKAWVDIADEGEQKGAIVSFDRINVQGATAYQLAIPKNFAVNDEKIQGIKGKLTQHILENQGRSLLYQIGLRFSVAELQYMQPPVTRYTAGIPQLSTIPEAKPAEHDLVAQSGGGQSK